MLLSAVQPLTLLDYPGKVAAIAFLPGCNFRCRFCHNPEFVLPERIATIQKDFIAESVFFRFLEKRRGLLDGIVISGGEPTIHQDLPDFIRKIRSFGFLVKLDTNGTHPDMLAFLYNE
jgi:pyruvate formate lyase activating enzyme